MVSLKDRDQKEFQEKLQTEMAAQHVDGLILTDYGAIYYATGYASKFQYFDPRSGTTIAVVPAKGPCTLIVSEFEMQTPLAQCKDVNVEIVPCPVFIDELEVKYTSKPVKTDSKIGFRLAMDILLADNPKAVIGYQHDYVTIEPYLFMKSYGKDATMVDCGALLNAVRCIKTSWEIDALRTAAQLSEKSLWEIVPRFHVGMTMAEYLNMGAVNAFSQDPKVTEFIDMCAFGKHFSPAFFGMNDPCREGDILRYDGGLTLLGYVTDFARTFCMGKASDRAKRIYAAEVAGYETAMSLIRPGESARYVFEKAQQAVRDNGIPNYLRGFVGHSIGCNHFAEEWPYISPNSDIIFKPGMVFSVEIPYYNPNVGGFNIEDTIVITETGYEKFTDCPREIVELNV